MNELDYVLIFIILLGGGIGLWRGFIRVLLSIVGIYFTVLIAGYAYKPIGDTLAQGLDRVGFDVSVVGAHNFSFVVLVIALTVGVELLSRSTFDETHLRSVRNLDALLGGIAGVFYGMLWAALFLVPAQYDSASARGAWYTAVTLSKLVPTLNRVFQNAVLDLVSFLFVGGVPELYRNRISVRIAYLFLDLASSRYLFI